MLRSLLVPLELVTATRSFLVTSVKVIVSTTGVTSAEIIVNALSGLTCAKRIASAKVIH